MNDNTPDDTGPLTTRREALGGVGLGLTTALAPLPLSFATDALNGTLSELAMTYRPLFGEGEGTQRVIEYRSEAVPSWIVQYEEDKRDSLLEWIGSNSERTLLDEHEPTQSATIIAPVEHVGAAWFDRQRANGLAGRSWVEMVDLNISVSIAEPVVRLRDDLDGDGTGVGLSRWERRLLNIGSDLPNITNIGFDGDAEEVRPFEIREIVGADTGAVDEATRDKHEAIERRLAAANREIADALQQSVGLSTTSYPQSELRNTHRELLDAYYDLTQTIDMVERAVGDLDDHAELAKQVTSDHADRLKETYDEPLVYVALQLLDANRREWLHGKPDTNGAQEVERHGLTANQREWLNELQSTSQDDT